MGTLPIFTSISLKDGRNIRGARLRVDVPSICGFLPIDAQSPKHEVEYIAVSDLKSFTVSEEMSFYIADGFAALPVDIKKTVER